jgi:hypothetical protein
MSKSPPKIPQELRITINTDIPGYQEFNYEPLMTIPDITKDSTILFNPLIKIPQNKINEIPESVRIKQFFNKGLFHSLINYIDKSPVENLIIANEEGYIDNNIKTTINTIFPINSVLYIKEKPFVILSLDWNNGEFVIKDLPKKPDITSNSNSKLLKHIKPNETAVFITVDMVLQPGKTANLTSAEINKLKCHNKWYKVQKSFNKLFHKKKIMKPNYAKISRGGGLSKRRKIKKHKSKTLKILKNNYN